MTGLCEGGNEPPGSLKAIESEVDRQLLVVSLLQCLNHVTDRSKPAPFQVNFELAENLEDARGQVRAVMSMFEHLSAQVSNGVHSVPNCVWSRNVV
ncbi:hypothetical protein ANN_04042 [Periplaneta americana]|uniref:Uncharacterized protein n=1 Tax=Periplaneta americana TaxID=6978 RepID=A0ABQ8T916_PERAM|nr:hypothetical protein ANN_04042 [Periplaneta americana]